jgi:hypothetical protein
VRLSDPTIAQRGPWHVAAALAQEVLSSGLADATQDLEPRDKRGFIIPSSDREEYDEALEELRASATASLSFVDLDEVERLLHVVVRNALELIGFQALCLRASMVNHACTPNATHCAFARTTDKQLFVCIRAVDTIKAGSPITISYIGDLASSFAERKAALAHHGIEPARRGCDAALVAWREQLSEDAKLAVERQIGGCNLMADAAWQEAESLRTSAVAAAAHGSTDGGLGSSDEVEASMKRKLMEAAAHYAKLLQLGASALGERHELLLQARTRLAKVMTGSGAERSRANALPLWQAVLAATRPCVPACWPALLEPLRGIANAAEAAGDSELAASAQQEADDMLKRLNPGCTDVQATGRVPWASAT